mgnify:CR=1 FL=1
MKKMLLWIVNTIFPYPAEKLGMKKTSFGGWLNSLFGTLRKSENFELAIATVYNGKNMQKMDDGQVIYYLLPGAPALKYDKKIEKYWKFINEEFKPDLVHINGTEFAHGLAFINACPNVTTVTSIQGLVSVYADVYYANIPVKDIIKNITFRDIVKNDNIIQGRKKFIKRGKNEIEILKKTNAITGRTIWDYSNVQAINPNVKFYWSNRILREEFYQSKKWDISNMERHSIFSSQAGYPIKGLHYMIEAARILKREYPDIKVYVAGQNITKSDTIKEKMRLSDYGKYIRGLIKKYKLEENVVFTGMLDAQGMVDKLLNSNVFVQTSAIENSPNSLGEAMLLGVPCVASYVGGTCDMLEHKKEGFLYTYTEPAILAEYIKRIFENDKLCMKFSKNAINKANDTHNKERITQETIDMYNDILNKE